LQNYYGVDLTTINWVSGRDDSGVVPAGIKVENLPAHEGDTDHLLDQLLLDGKLDAVLSPNVLPSITARDPRTRRLFVDYRGEEQRYYRETGIFPISHVVTLKRDFVERYPHAPVALLEAYRRARDEAINRIEGSDPVILTISWATVNLAEQRELMGDRYWPYNIEDNKKSLDAMLEYSFQQGITRTKLDLMSFFDPAAAALPGF
jgi:4,5-dihydroxyphthalate decarboxylase